MIAVHFATTSKRKYNNLKLAFEPFRIPIIWEKLDIPEVRSDDVSIVAKEKVIYAYNLLNRPGLPCVAWDIGLYICSLNGFPGTYVHWVVDRIGAEGILRLVEGKRRDCEFRNCFAYFDGEGSAECFVAKSEGILADSLRGNLSEWDLHRIFIPAGWGASTIAQMKDQDLYVKYRRERYGSFFNEVAQWINRRLD